MNATFPQRAYLCDLHLKLEWSAKGIRDMTVEECSRGIDRAEKELASRPRRDGGHKGPDTEVGE